MKENTVYWANVKNKKNEYIIMATHKGICWVGKKKNFEKGKLWVQKRIGNADFIYSLNNKVLEKAAYELSNYFSGKKVIFSGPFDIYGTKFQKDVWSEMLKIPYSHTKTYGEIARLVGKPKAVRAVGGACGANPIMILIPCHRVVGSLGKLTGYAGGIELKKELLSLEQQNHS